MEGGGNGAGVVLGGQGHPRAEGEQGRLGFVQPRNHRGSMGAESLCPPIHTLKPCPLVWLHLEAGPLRK